MAKLMTLNTDEMRFWKRAWLEANAPKVVGRLPRKNASESGENVWLAVCYTSDTEREQPTVGDYIRRTSSDGNVKFWRVAAVGKMVIAGDPSVYVKRSTYMRVEQADAAADQSLAALIAADAQRDARAMDWAMNS